MDRIMIDHKAFVPRRSERHSAVMCAMLALLVTVMGWSAFEPPRPTPTLLDKAELKRLTMQALAEHTVAVNAEMERRAKGGKR